MATPIFPPTTTTSLLVNTRTTPKIVYLPAASTIQSGKLLFIKDICGNAANSSIFLSTTGIDQLDGRTTRSTLYGLMNINFQGILLASDGMINWMILQNYNSNSISRGFRGNISATGGTIVSAGGFTYHVFTTSGTFTVNATNGTTVANYLAVGGGGGGGDRHGGGGGAGGVLGGTFTPIVTGYTITVGAGGQYGATGEGGQTPYGNPAGSGTKGGDSIIAGVATAFGGGGGGTLDGNPSGVSGSVGSGGGGGGNNHAGVAGTAGQGNAGGNGANPAGGAGGGAGAVGANANTSTGGIGITTYSVHLLRVGYGTTFATSPQSPISGGVAYIAGGGGGSADSATAPTSRAGGLGGGGTGDWDDAVITAGTANTGGGGGASRSNTTSTTGRNGGSGLVIIWYT